MNEIRELRERTSLSGGDDIGDDGMPAMANAREVAINTMRMPMALRSESADGLAARPEMTINMKKD